MYEISHNLNLISHPLNLILEPISQHPQNYTEILMFIMFDNHLLKLFATIHQYDSQLPNSFDKLSTYRSQLSKPLHFSPRFFLYSKLLKSLHWISNFILIILKYFMESFQFSCSQFILFYLNLNYQYFYLSLFRNPSSQLFYNFSYSIQFLKSVSIFRVYYFVQFDFQLFTHFSYLLLLHLLISNDFWILSLKKFQIKFLMDQLFNYLIQKQ